MTKYRKMTKSRNEGESWVLIERTKCKGHRAIKVNSAKMGTIRQEQLQGNKRLPQDFIKSNFKMHLEVGYESSSTREIAQKIVFFVIC